MRIYLAGPITPKLNLYGFNSWEVTLNRDTAKYVAFQLWEKGFSVLSPHLNTIDFEGGLPNEVWLKGDLDWISVSDALVVLPDWERSNGTKQEIAFARSQDIPVYFWSQTLRDAFTSKGEPLRRR